MVPISRMWADVKPADGIIRFPLKLNALISGAWEG
ncbi:hypothetical protein B0I31_114132 [Saccharothrix carnea]|uniref:Uncharacterized protein n=1 Tax=Saccharothrix carnea TaxID=1280637 RepID=A0A2P8I1G8_SACCR|nr:hypothetical protein B0I31_114132 [Saccharothrix carnea]